MKNFSDLLRCAGSVAPPPFGKRNTTHLLFFSLRDTKRNFKIMCLSQWRDPFSFVLPSAFCREASDFYNLAYTLLIDIKLFCMLRVSCEHLTYSVTLGLFFRS